MFLVYWLTVHLFLRGFSIISPVRHPVSRVSSHGITICITTTLFPEAIVPVWDGCRTLVSCLLSLSLSVSGLFCLHGVYLYSVEGWEMISWLRFSWIREGRRDGRSRRTNILEEEHSQGRLIFFILISKVVSRSSLFGKENDDCKVVEVNIVHLIDHQSNLYDKSTVFDAFVFCDVVFSCL